MSHSRSTVFQAPGLTEADLRLVADSIPHIVFMSGVDGAPLYLNRQGIAYSGTREDGASRWDWVSMVHPDDATRVSEAWGHAAATAGTVELDYRLRRFDGEYRWHTLRSLPIVDDDGAVVRWIGTATDVDEVTRAVAAQAITDDALRFQATLLDTVGQAVVAVDVHRTIIYWNRASEELYGWTAAEAVGRSSIDVLPREESAEQATALFAAMRRGERWAGDYKIRRQDGSEIPVFVTNTPVLDENGRVVAVIGVSMDMTERIAAEGVRLELAAIVGGSGDAIFGATLDGAVTSWNHAAESLFGYTADEMIGTPLAVLAAGDGLAEQVGMRYRLGSGGAPERIETVRRRKDGSLVDVLITASTAMNEAGEVVGLSVIAQEITERLAQRHALEASERRLAEAQRLARLGSFEFDPRSDCLTWSDECYRILGVDTDVVPTIDFLVSRVHPDDVESVVKMWVDGVDRGVPFDDDVRMIRSDGATLMVRARAVPELAEDGTVVKVVGTVMDETERAETERVRRAAETRFEFGFEQAAIGAAIIDLEGIPRRVNPALCSIMGRTADQLVGQDTKGYRHPDDPSLLQEVRKRIAAGHDTAEVERRFLRTDGSTVWGDLHISLVRDEAGEPQYFYLQVQDVTARKMAEEELAHSALHDALTGLPNRVLLTDRLVHGLAGSRRRGTQLGVMFLDVDHFKVVNDSLGHTAGDDLLRHVADRIAGAIRPDDTVARFGGDEFVVVCDDITTDEIEQIAGRVLASITDHCVIGRQEMNMTASLGIAISDREATPESLLRDSDAAMYRAKELGRSRIELFDEAERSKVDQRLATVSALHHALDRGEFAVHYQPIIDLASGAIVSTEALLRWEHPERGQVSPAEFIPLAEETGLILPIGAWVLEEAAAQLLEWQGLVGRRPAAGDARRLSMAVNLSVRQLLAPDVVDTVADVLRRTGVHPGDLCLELTESLFMQDVEYFGRTLAGLKALGVRLAIDDFGTGYSSLSYLKRFPVDAVKVDRDFVDGLGTDPHDSALVAAIVAMADALGLEVTAEGVETEAQLVILEHLQCGQAQGFHLARPMPPADLTALLASSHRWIAPEPLGSAGRYR